MLALNSPRKQCNVSPKPFPLAVNEETHERAAMSHVDDGRGPSWWFFIDRVRNCGHRNGQGPEPPHIPLPPSSSGSSPPPKKSEKLVGSGGGPRPSSNGSSATVGEGWRAEAMMWGKKGKAPKFEIEALLLKDARLGSVRYGRPLRAPRALQLVAA
ncbi:hypothetical protein PIB30_055914 [Stylosanthes scabra]|uniref:Uncharacterized protein n=1 Tax=Stylosanthes scabra TaxID=79078 RepID=A0ABU6TK39_9FABA|nr:hypothetical protein [Stylosanthes scabra]